MRRDKILGWLFSISIALWLAGGLLNLTMYGTLTNAAGVV